MTIAHLNWGLLKHDFDDPRVAEFVNNIGRVNAMAERSPGYVWRHDGNLAEAKKADPDRVFLASPRAAFTLSVWRDVAAFAHFVHNTMHGKLMAKRQNWFETHAGPSHVIWPIEAAHRPGVVEAADRFNALAQSGPSDAQFDLSYARQNGWITPSVA